jgi:hypothetical protein
MASSLASQLPQFFVVNKYDRFTRDSCGSWLASEGDLINTINSSPATQDLSRLTALR